MNPALAPLLTRIAEDLRTAKVMFENATGKSVLVDDLMEAWILVMQVSEHPTVEVS